MEDYQKRWNQCLQLIQEYLPKDKELIPNDDAKWVYETWFASLSYKSYDDATGNLVLRAPNKYVCEYIEHYHMKLWVWAVRKTFGPKVKLDYDILSVETKKSYLAGARGQRLQFAIPNARERMEEELRRAVGTDFQWLRCQGQNGSDICYDKIADWLTDNKGKGLLFVGPTGAGKSKMCCDILPAIIGGDDRQKIPVVTAREMRSRIDELKKARVVVIDGLGREGRKNYGDDDNTFLDLCDASVDGGPLLIVNTQLSTTPVHSKGFPLSIEERYGREVLDRLATVTTMALYTGDSLWS